MTGVERRVEVVEPSRGSAFDALDRIFSLAGAVRRGTLKLALLALGAAAVLAYALLRHGFPGQPGRAVLTVIALIFVAAPPVVLGAFWFVLGELLELPERVRRLPLETRDHAEQLGRLSREARARRGGWASPGQLWRLARLTSSSRELLTPYAPVLPLLSPPFLLSVAVAALAVGLEVAIALVVLLVLLVT